MARREVTQQLDCVGLGFRMKRDVRDKLAQLVAKKPIKVTLEREPENEYDINAIKVTCAAAGEFKDKHFGYVRGETAAILAPQMDEGNVTVKAAHLHEVREMPDHRQTHGVMQVTLYVAG